MVLDNEQSNVLAQFLEPPLRLPVSVMRVWLNGTIQSRLLRQQRSVAIVIIINRIVFQGEGEPGNFPLSGFSHPFAVAFPVVYWELLCQGWFSSPVSSHISVTPISFSNKCPLESGADPNWS